VQAEPPPASIFFRLAGSTVSLHEDGLEMLFSADAGLREPVIWTPVEGDPIDLIGVFSEEPGRGRTDDEKGIRRISRGRLTLYRYIDGVELVIDADSSPRGSFTLRGEQWTPTAVARGTVCQIVDIVQTKTTTLKRPPVQNIPG
jgi:hypothetical protein